MFPVFERDGFIVCVDVLREEQSAYDHFSNDCGWSHGDAKRVADYPFFCAEVSAWKDGKLVAYEKVSDFWTQKDGYFDDMVNTVIREAKACT